MQTVPFIPDNAPFTPEQRNWLNGFLAGIYSSAAIAPAAQPQRSIKIAVLYGSQSGTAEGLARKLAKELKAKGHVASLNSLEGYTPAALVAERFAVIITSTYGDGEPPESARSFYEELCLQHFPCCENLTYAVLALGDSSYEHFCKFGIDLDNKLSSLAGNRLCPRVDCDVDFDESFAAWKSSLDQAIEDLTADHATRSVVSATGEASSPNTQKPAAKSHTRENPFFAALIDKRILTQDTSSKQTLHLAFDISGSDVRYEAGDSCGVIPQNNPDLVDEVLRVLSFSGSVSVELPRGGTTTLSDALLNHLQITRLTRRMVEGYATIGSCAPLFNLLSPDHQSQFESYIYDRGLIDLLHEYPHVLREPADLVAMLPNLTPRLYSISSSPSAHEGEIHTTVAVVRYQSHNRERGGVCSTLFADRANKGDALPVYIQQNRRFRLPVDSEAPIIMIGPGTGIAPFRGFLHERRALNHKGRNWLFFGERSAATDFLYREELESMHRDGHLTRLDVAFSRDQEQKIYVQNRMAEHGQELFRWLEEGASVYVCGDASRMAKDVDAAILNIVRTHGGMSPDSAGEYVSILKDNHRYHRDVY